MILTSENLGTISKLGRVLFKNVAIKNANVTIDKDGYLCIDGLAIAICEKSIRKAQFKEARVYAVAIHYFALAERSVAVHELTDGSWLIRGLKSGRGNADRIASRCKLSELGHLIALAIYCKKANMPTNQLFQQVTAIGEEVSAVTNTMSVRKMTVRKLVGYFKITISPYSRSRTVAEYLLPHTALPKLLEVSQVL